MKFLHISDLHIGKIVNGFSMIDDQEYILNQILTHIRNHNPRALVISGDIYDRPVPDAQAVKLFDSFLWELSRENIVVLAISGNHDSPERLGFASGILNSRDVYIYGVFNGAMQRVTLEDEYGAVNFYLLPFVRPALVKPYFEDKLIETYDDAVKTVLQNECLKPEQRNVLICHQFVASGSETPVLSESERSAVGGIDVVSAYYMQEYDYVALGHLHSGQKALKESIRYAGSPLKYSASEISHRKSAVLIELKEKTTEPEITLLPLEPLRDMRKIKGPFKEIIKPEITEQANCLDYIHVVLTDEYEISDPVGKLRRIYPNIMSLSFDNSRSNAKYMPEGQTVNEEISPVELFKEFYKSQNGASLNNAQLKIIENLLEEENI